MRRKLTRLSWIPLILTLPYWLPSLVIRLRMWLFTKVNGEEGLQLPNDKIDATRFKQIYGHKNAAGRSQGAALSDLFWYWLSPGAEMHQEHIENGERYEYVARMTREILAVPANRIEALTEKCMGNVLAEKLSRPWQVVRLRDLLMPVWAEFYYELVFAEQCPAYARQLIVGNASDVVNALKGCSLRHMPRRNRLTRFLEKKLRQGAFGRAFPTDFTVEEQAFYLQGTYFNTAIVQMSEAVAHTLLAVAQHPQVQERLAAHTDDEHYYDLVVTETLRLFPLFGIAHRITSGDIVVDDETTLPRGSVLCFNYPAYHQTGYDRPDTFLPERWEQLSQKEAHYIPFGVYGNRSCPAQRIALISMKKAAQIMLGQFQLYSSASHTRSMPNRAPCLVVAREARLPYLARGSVLSLMKLQDQWEDVVRSIQQLFLGSFMVWHARQLKLAENHFANTVS
ncbi:MAG: cytochrome P450 [Chloroflexi bacterium]|nr:cytochrome P450 [Chloroflexota bacterium]MCI0580874.1 cytochrome P450 [Chloroflexota bacterium]MCI0648251.1 cytochrome P450 [Chloroflexota bacterium]MCI0725929.1 cytochrome P450 [Chloroflexota bacterium]